MQKFVGNMGALGLLLMILGLMSLTHQVVGESRRMWGSRSTQLLLHMRGGEQVNGNQSGEEGGNTQRKDSRDPRWSLENRKYIVTGGTKGIGKAIVEQLCSLGAQVLTCGRDEKTLAEAMSDWSTKGIASQVKTCIADVSTPQGRKFLIDQFKSEMGDTCDGLVNNVGSNIRKKTHEYTDEDYYKVFQTNFDSCFFLSRDVFPLLKEGGGVSSW